MTDQSFGVGSKDFVILASRQPCIESQDTMIHPINSLMYIFNIEFQIMFSYELLNVDKTADSISMIASSITSISSSCYVPLQ